MSLVFVSATTCTLQVPVRNKQAQQEDDQYPGQEPCEP